jgi:hypothetical protein
MYCYLNYICVEHFFEAGVLGPPVWEPDPKILRGHAGAPIGHKFESAGGDTLMLWYDYSTRNKKKILHTP